jgi:hypothetical protein
MLRSFYLHSISYQFECLESFLFIKSKQLPGLYKTQAPKILTKQYGV